MQILTQNPSVPAGTRVVAPVRAEPRAWLANERTFLSWMQACSTLVVAAAGITAAADAPALRITGVLLGAPGLVFAVNAVMMYYSRRHQLEKRSVSSYAAKKGPLALCVVTTLVVVFNLIANLLRIAFGHTDNFDFSTITPQ